MQSFAVKLPDNSLIESGVGCAVFVIQHSVPALHVAHRSDQYLLTCACDAGEEGGEEEEEEEEIY